MHDEVSLGVGRADMEQIDTNALKVDGRVMVDHGGRWGEDHLGEVEVRPLLMDRSHRLGWVDHRADHLGPFRGEIHESISTSAVRDDLGSAEHLIAPAVIAVVVGVDQSCRGLRMHLGVEVCQFACERDVVE